MSPAGRQMDPARRAAGKKPDAAAPGNARIVPRLFTSALGGGLSAWAHAIRGDSEARLRDDLPPFPKSAQLQPDRNQRAEATRLFAEILAVEPDWPDAL